MKPAFLQNESPPWRRLELPPPPQQQIFFLFSRAYTSFTISLALVLSTRLLDRLPLKNWRSFFSNSGFHFPPPSSREWRQKVPFNSPRLPNYRRGQEFNQTLCNLPNYMWNHRSVPAVGGRLQGPCLGYPGLSRHQFYPPRVRPFSFLRIFNLTLTKYFPKMFLLSLCAPFPSRPCQETDHTDNNHSCSYADLFTPILFFLFFCNLHASPCLSLFLPF